MEELKFVRCPETKNVSEVLYVADGAGLELLKANSTDAAGEKHVPVVSQDGNVVKVVVGSVEHPMTEEHYIPFIVVQTDKRVLRKDLTRRTNRKPASYWKTVKNSSGLTNTATCTAFGKLNKRYHLYAKWGCA